VFLRVRNEPAMDIDGLLSPINDEAPCGPDLDGDGDNDYFNYTLAAESRLPETFFNFKTEKIFDRTTIKLDDERRKLNELLGRSRDLRLLVLMAQFYASAGDFFGFCRTIDTVAGLLSRYWLDVHPQAQDGDLEMRRVALEGLNDRAKVVMPLIHAQLFADRRAGPVSLRAWQVAQRPEIAYKDEEKPNPALLREAFSVVENRAGVDAAFEAVNGANRRLGEIRGRFQSEGAFEQAPVFDELLTTLADIGKLLLDNAPHLQAVAAAAPEPSPEPSPAETAVAPAAFPAPVRPPSAAGIQSHREARAALSALETYFAENEPSSPALILVHQARLLIGRPLVEALAALAPAQAGGAMLMVDPASGFCLDMERMKQLTVAVPAILRRLAGPEPGMRDRGEALAAMLGIEEFLAAREPSSPVTMLLSRARAMMGSNFPALLRELLQEEKKS